MFKGKEKLKQTGNLYYWKCLIIGLSFCKHQGQGPKVQILSEDKSESFSSEFGPNFENPNLQILMCKKI